MISYLWWLGLPLHDCIQNQLPCLVPWRAFVEEQSGTVCRFYRRLWTLKTMLSFTDSGLIVFYGWGGCGITLKTFPDSNHSLWKLVRRRDVVMSVRLEPRKQPNAKLDFKAPRCHPFLDSTEEKLPSAHKKTTTNLWLAAYVVIRHLAITFTER